MSHTTQLWIGRIIGGLLVLFLAFDSIIHIMRIAPVVTAAVQLGFSPSVFLPLGIIELIAVIFYIIPRTSVLGAIVLTGYLGGAVCANLHEGLPLFSTILFPVYIGILLWFVLWLLRPKVRALFQA